MYLLAILIVWNHRWFR